MHCLQMPINFILVHKVGEANWAIATFVTLFDVLFQFILFFKASKTNITLKPRFIFVNPFDVILQVPLFVITFRAHFTLMVFDLLVNRLHVLSQALVANKHSSAQVAFSDDTGFVF